MGLKRLLIETEEGLFGTTGTTSPVPQLPDGTPFFQRSYRLNSDYEGRMGGAPLIWKDLPGVEEETNSTPGLINQITGGFVRGGLLGASTRAFTDAKRLGKFLITPKGLTWLATNYALQKTSPFTILENKGRQFSGIGTFASAVTNFAGIRFRKDRFLDIKFESGYNYDPKRGGPKYENTLRSLAINDADDTSDHTVLGVYTNLKLGSSPDTIKEYKGGPHSIFGIGSTKIKRYKQNPYGGFYKTPGLEYIETFNEEFDQGSYGFTNPDFRVVKKKRFDGIPLPFTPIERHRQRVYRMGDPGLFLHGKAPDENGVNYGVYNVNTIDHVSAANIFKRTDLAELKEFKDYIKFRIAVVDVENPLNDKVILFRALLDTINDNYSGTWNSHKYNGRAEKFYVYEGFDRQIQFNFKIHAQSRHEMRPLWRKLNYLVAQTAPEYKNLRMRGVFSRLTIGDWMNELPGFFTSVNLSWNSSYPWEIRYDGQEGGVDENMNEYPHILEVQCSFTPVHSFTPSNEPCAPFILPEFGVNEGRKWGKSQDDEFVPEGKQCFDAESETEAFIDQTPSVELPEPLPVEPIAEWDDNQQGIVLDTLDGLDLEDIELEEENLFEADLEADLEEFRSQQPEAIIDNLEQVLNSQGTGITSAGGIGQ